MRQRVLCSPHQARIRSLRCCFWHPDWLRSASGASWGRVAHAFWVRLHLIPNALCTHRLTHKCRRTPTWTSKEDHGTHVFASFAFSCRRLQQFIPSPFKPSEMTTGTRCLSCALLCCLLYFWIW